MHPDDLLCLAHRLAPETRDRLYVLKHSPELGLRHPLVGARTIRAAANHAGLRDLLTARGEWRGLHDAIVFYEEPSVGVLLHELAHALPIRRQLDLPPPDDEEREFQATADRVIADRGPVIPDHLPPWFLHEWQWIRRVIHLRHRAAELGFLVSLEDCRMAGSWYGLSDPSCYWYSLYDEPSRMANWSFADIERTEPPAAFMATWRKDTQEREAICT